MVMSLVERISALRAVDGGLSAVELALRRRCYSFADKHQPAVQRCFCHGAICRRLRGASAFWTRLKERWTASIRDRDTGEGVIDVVAPLGESCWGGQAHMLQWRRVGGDASPGAASRLKSGRVPPDRQRPQPAGACNLAIEGDVVPAPTTRRQRPSVMSLVERISALRAVDGGALANSRYVEGITALLININRL